MAISSRIAQPMCHWDRRGRRNGGSLAPMSGSRGANACQNTDRGATGAAEAGSYDAPMSTPASLALPFDALESFLDGEGLGHGPITATPIGDGASNLTYRLE